MLDIAFGETREYNKSILVGLAAPQIGISKRIIHVDKAATGLFVQEQTSAPPPQIDVYINPEIAWRSDETNVWREGCFSTSRICGLVPRSSKVLVRAYDREGTLLTKEFSGYTARIFQHEIDHLDGILFFDHLSILKREILIRRWKKDNKGSGEGQGKGAYQEGEKGTQR